VRHILEYCITVDEAVKWIQAVPHSQSRNYMLADATKAVVVEATIDGVYIREPEDGVLVMTNHPAHPQLVKQVNFVPDDSLMRYTRLRTLSDNSITLDDIKAALNDRKNYVCAHHQFDGQFFGTIWSVIACPEEHQLAIAPGTGDNEGVMEYRSYRL
jgi:predicted choloylglycine hydrolase